jgi:hypothetical protein
MDDKQILYDLSYSTLHFWDYLANRATIIDMATIHISGVDASRNFAGLMVMVRSGAEVIIEDGAYPPAVLRSAEPVRRTISECIELARKHEEDTGEAPVLDPDFAEDVAEIIRNRKPWTPPAWD